MKYEVYNDKPDTIKKGLITYKKDFKDVYK